MHPRVREYVVPFFPSHPRPVPTPLILNKMSTGAFGTLLNRHCPVLAAAAIITLCPRAFTDNAGDRLHPRRMSDTPSSHSSCAACKTAFDMCCILSSSALSF